MAEATAVNYLNATRGWKSWLLTLDHKRIAILYMAAIAVFFFVGGVLAMLIRLELLHPGRDLVGADTYNKLFTLHGAIMIFLFIIPGVPAILGNFLLPLMLGARDVAFPRLNLASWYIFMLGSLFALYSIVAGAADTGWTFYTPYSTQTDTSVISMTLGAFILGFSSIFTGLNFIVTIHKLRLPGMTWYRMPLFVWSMYATAIIQVLATPVLGITLLLLVIERVAGIGIFDPAMGGDPVLYQHFFWFYSHPAVYIMILPGMGIVSELITAHAHKKIFGYKAVAYSSLGIAFVSFLVWGHHMFVSGQSELAAMLFSFLTFFVGIPSGIKVFNWVTTLYRGSIKLTTPMLYALSFLFLFSIGGFTGIMLGALAVDVHVHDTYFIVAHFHYVMMGGTVIAFLGGLHHWWPKMFGRMYNEPWAKVACALIFVGFNVTFGSQFLLGLHGMPRRYYNYLDQYQPLHAFSTFGSWILGAGFVIMAIYLIHSLARGRRAGSNPWRALTLEWETPSPPPTENFPFTPSLAHGPYDYDRVIPVNVEPGGRAVRPEVVS
ncbi:MAG TPA: cytochrome c oxidase subunit I [candidate division Zixibacteria bacterium]|nr:cytochrome c oxidase subunit I [candidate division Zixibacteria bacterium]MDD4918775.1 cytochrome c oxidase subunit I [candidate division Zixibacteria bacterium]MDM7971492.1 cytochrome c oxidase subunit I [candidate division Zixibacteria bacterium]HOD65995.1 cytochrome c oxidase subunit I [candidate division Zixibacteria bacterium]HPC10812.1 cytochrome c oxidase subunit I [candidate division Zixibacteria bacterium]